MYYCCTLNLQSLFISVHKSFKSFHIFRIRCNLYTFFFCMSAYGDADAVSAFAQDAMAWAVAEGLVNGRSAAELAPKAGATRAELATILFRFAALQNA